MMLTAWNFVYAFKTIAKYENEFFVIRFIQCVHSCFLPFRNPFSSVRIVKIDLTMLKSLRFVRFISSMEWLSMG